MRRIILVAHNIRSAHNVGSLLRTADGLGVEEVILTGITPYPVLKKDPRLPHIAKKTAAKIHKTALGAEQSLRWKQADDIREPMEKLKQSGYSLVALEQSDKSLPLSRFNSPDKIALLVGGEIDGLAAQILDQCDFIVEIAMRGQKESFNVASAAAMALYHLSSLDKPSA